jgi:hypothetical protein
LKNKNCTYFIDEIAHKNRKNKQNLNHESTVKSKANKKEAKVVVLSRLLMN